MIDLDHFSPFAALLLQLERRLEEVDVKPCRRIEAAHYARRLEAIEAPIAHETADDGTILLLDERLIVLLVRARACDFELLFATPWYDDIVHEGAVVVEVHAAQEPGEQTLCAVDRLDDQRTFPRHQGQALRPARGDIDHRQGLDERASHRRAAMGDHVDLAEARRRAVPVIKRADRDLPPDCRIESGPAPPAAARRDLHINEQAIDGSGADGQNTITVSLAKLQSAMLLEGRQQDRDHHLEPLAAHPIRRLPQRRHRVLDRRTISTLALSRCLDLARPNRLALPKCAHRMLAMPARRRA